MTHTGNLLAWILIILCPAAWAGGVSQSYAHDSVSILYIESNTGDSSGGHAALRCGNDVFHFQHADDGLLVLHKESFRRFRYFYNDLGNRTIHEAELDLPPQAAQAVWEHFTRSLIIQEERLGQIADLEADAAFLNSIKGSSGRVRISARGAGLFQLDGEKAVSCWKPLSEKIHEQLGKNFIKHQLDDVRDYICTLPENPSAYLAEPFLASSGLHDAISLYAALYIINKMPGPAPSAMIEVPGEGCGSLTTSERTSVAKWRNFFEDSVMCLLSSSRPDRGRALMVACARFLAAQYSLETGKLYVLNTIPDSSIRVNGVEHAGGRKILSRLEHQIRAKLLSERKEVLESQQDEIKWCLFENMASKYAEIDACSRGERQMMRVYSGTKVPERKGLITISGLRAGSGVDDSIKLINQKLETLQITLGREMRYNLFTANCVTELFRNIEAAISSCPNTDIDSHTLGTIRNISFIPWKMFQQVTSGACTGQIRTYPSWRNRVLAKLYESENPTAIYLQECNTITAKTYTTGRQDSAFLFFTDSTPIIRPLFGALNIAYGVLRTAVGVVTLPADSGYFMESGAYGVLFSIPELCFINIRKGNYSYIETKEPIITQTARESQS